MRLRAAERFDLLRALLFGRAEALGQLRGSAGAEAAGLSLLLSGFLVILREQEGRSRAGESDGTRTAFLLSLSLYCGTFILFFFIFLSPLRTQRCLLSGKFNASWRKCWLRGAELSRRKIVRGSGRNIVDFHRLFTTLSRTGFSFK